MPREFIVGLPSYPTKQRMKEVQFYLIMKQLTKNQKDSIYIDNIIENLAQQLGVKISNINYAIGNLETIQFKPTPLELILCAKYIGIKMRTVCSLVGKASRTLYNSLEKYVNEGHYDIHPKLSPQIIEDIEIFNKGLQTIFGNISELINTSVSDENGKKVEYIYDID